MIGGRKYEGHEWLIIFQGEGRTSFGLGKRLSSQLCFHKNFPIGPGPFIFAAAQSGRAHVIIFGGFRGHSEAAPLRRTHTGTDRPKLLLSILDINNFLLCIIFFFHQKYIKNAIIQESKREIYIEIQCFQKSSGQNLIKSIL